MIDRETYLTDEEIVMTAKHSGDTLFDRLALVYQTDEVIRFGRAIEKAVTQKAAEAERSACARLAEAEMWGEPINEYQDGCDNACMAIAKSIRARGTGGAG